MSNTIPEPTPCENCEGEGCALCELGDRISELEAENTELRKEVTEWEDHALTLEGTIAALKDELSEAQRERDGWKKASQKIGRVAAVMQAERDKQKKRLEARNADLRKLVNGLDRELEAIRKGGDNAADHS